jgi:hypothetical protein
VTIARLPVRFVVALLIATPASAQSTATIPPEVCDSLRLASARQADSVMAIKPGQWVPDPNNRRLIESLRTAQVVIQVRMDTAGNPDPSTFRAVRWKDQAFVRLARQEVSRIDPTPWEPFPGCRVPYVLTLPFVFSSSR